MTALKRRKCAFCPRLLRRNKRERLVCQSCQQRNRREGMLNYWNRRKS